MTERAEYPAPLMSIGEISQALYAAFDTVIAYPTRPVATLDRLLGVRDLTTWGEPAGDGTIAVFTHTTRVTCIKEPDAVGAVRRHVMALWANNLRSEEYTAIKTIHVQCNHEEAAENFIEVTIHWSTPLHPCVPPSTPSLN
jgi:hypothetical protein